MAGRKGDDVLVILRARRVSSITDSHCHAGFVAKRQTREREKSWRDRSVTVSVAAVAAIDVSKRNAETMTAMRTRA